MIRERRRLRLGVVVAVVAAALAVLLLQGLGDATTFYRDADQAVAKKDELGTKRFRLQGVVAPGTIKDVGADISFVVEYRCVRVPVMHRGTRPPLFKDGVPVVLEGRFASSSSKTFESDRIIVRHTEQYRTDASQNAEAVEKERCAR